MNIRAESSPLCRKNRDRKQIAERRGQTLVRPRLLATGTERLLPSPLWAYKGEGGGARSARPGGVDRRRPPRYAPLAPTLALKRGRDSQRSAPKRQQEHVQMAGLELKNPALERMRAGDVALGMPVRLGRSGDIARIAKTSGHDFIFIDMQHSLFSVETVGHIAQAALGCGISPLARVLGVDDPMTPLLLDNGVTGIVFPDVGTADQARRAVDRAKFPPVGKRSVAGGYPQFDFRPVA